jgi:hypothetical protein
MARCVVELYRINEIWLVAFFLSGCLNMIYDQMLASVIMSALKFFQDILKSSEVMDELGIALTAALLHCD